MNQWLRRLDLRWNRALLLQAALLLVPPVTAFYLGRSKTAGCDCSCFNS